MQEGKGEKEGMQMVKSKQIEKLSTTPGSIYLS